MTTITLSITHSFVPFPTCPFCATSTALSCQPNSSSSPCQNWRKGKQWQRTLQHIIPTPTTPNIFLLHPHIQHCSQRKAINPSNSLYQASLRIQSNSNTSKQQNKASSLPSCRFRSVLSTCLKLHTDTFSRFYIVSSSTSTLTCAQFSILSTDRD